MNTAGPFETSKRTVSEFEKVLDCSNIIVTSYGFVLNFFPIYCQLKVKNNTNGIKSSIFALNFCFCSYITFSLFAYGAYGNNIQVSIFDNIKTDLSFLSIFASCTFIVIFPCNISFVFFICKESFCTMILELTKKEISSNLARKLGQIYTV